MSETKHAILSPSGAHRWMVCPGSTLLEKGLPNTDSVYSKEGTAAHELASLVLEGPEGGHVPCSGYVGRVMTNGVEVTEDMSEHVQTYVDYVLGVTEAVDGILMVEQSLPLTQITGEADAFGTSDAVILGDGELIVVDLKFGMGERVDAEENKQLMIYALAAHHQFSVIGEYNSVRLVIHQPRIQHLSEWVIPLKQLLAFEVRVLLSAGRAAATYKGNTPPVFTPGEKQCRWCKASGNCPAQDTKIQEDIGAQFDNLDAVQPLETLTNNELGHKLDAVDFIESWCKAVRAKVESKMLAGETVVGKAGAFKLVKGKKGNRKWKDEALAEAMLKGFQLTRDQMYDFSLISPTTAEKLKKNAVIGEVRWKKLAPNIGQAEGKLHVAPATDKREAVKPEDIKDEFEDLTDTPAA